MKRIYTLILAAFLLFTCTPADKPQTSGISFEISGIIMPGDIPSEILIRLPENVIRTDTVLSSPFLAYYQKADSSFVFGKIINDSLRLLPTAYPVSDPQGHYGIVAVEKEASISLSDVKKVKPEQNHILVYFNAGGAVKWASLTKSAKGKLIAFCIDQKIYSMTAIAVEIRNGIARIDGFNNAEEAEEIAIKLNSGAGN